MVAPISKATLMPGRIVNGVNRTVIWAAGVDRTLPPATGVNRTVNGGVVVRLFTVLCEQEADEPLQHWQANRPRATGVEVDHGPQSQGPRPQQGGCSVCVCGGGLRFVCIMKLSPANYKECRGSQICSNDRQRSRV